MGPPNDVTGPILYSSMYLIDVGSIAGAHARKNMDGRFLPAIEAFPILLPTIRRICYGSSSKSVAPRNSPNLYLMRRRMQFPIRHRLIYLMLCPRLPLVTRCHLVLVMRRSISNWRIGAWLDSLPALAALPCNKEDTVAWVAMVSCMDVASVVTLRDLLVDFWDQ